MNGQRGFTGTHRRIQEGMITGFDMTMVSNKINLEVSIGFASRNSLVTNKIYFKKCGENKKEFTISGSN